MIKDLLDDFAKDQRDNVINAIQIKVKKPLKQGDVKIEYDDRVDYGCITCKGVVMGFLHVDYSEPVVVFTPSPNLLP